MNFCRGSKFFNFIFVKFLFYHVALVYVFILLLIYKCYCQFMHYALVQFISLVAGEVNANVGLTFFCCIPIGSACTPLWSLLQQLYCWGFPTLILPHPVAISRPISDPPPSITTSCSCPWVIIMANQGSVMFCTLRFENHFPNPGPENLIPSED